MTNPRFKLRDLGSLLVVQNEREGAITGVPNDRACHHEWQPNDDLPTMTFCLPLFFGGWIRTEIKV